MKVGGISLYKRYILHILQWLDKVLFLVCYIFKNLQHTVFKKKVKRWSHLPNNLVLQNELRSFRHSGGGAWRCDSAMLNM